MSRTRLVLSLATAGLALLVGTAHAVTCPPGTRPQPTCVAGRCTVICVPDLSVTR